MMRRTEGERSHGKKRLIAAGLICITAFMIAGILSKYCFQLVMVQGRSMEPAYHSGQMVLIDKRGEEYRTGDVIAFYSETEGIFVIKRIAACPGESILVENGGAEEVKILPENGYFVLGDNREDSIDSRDPRIGIVYKHQIIGKVL